ncbi:hypothetical protein V5799_033919 [Amblyomma americanum]|uniref:Disintegrin domain-containing protein n=1 Tax=Amblyomma americanum TaxID=6943 RepID=A0AAQ4DLX8_AMBAM
MTVSTWRVLSVICYLIVITASQAANIYDQLKYFETLKVSDLSHSITKRGTQPSKHKFNTIKEVSFRAHGRDFRLILNPTKGLLSAHFKAYTVDGSGNKRPVWVDQNQFFEGRVFGELVSNVSAHIDEGVMTASIRIKDDTFVVEPSWRHIPNDNNATMIVYRASDVKYSWDPTHGAQSLTKYCGYVKENGNATEVAGDLTENLSHWNDGSSITSHVQKRQAMEPYHWEPVQTRCSLLLVADHRFYENMGGRNLKSTINFLITLIDRVNKIFLDTEWRDSDRHPGFRGMGFVIQEVMVHTEPTPVLRNEVHYNMAGVTWNVRDLLEKFSPCSVRSIRAVLLAKASKCFSKPEESFCGNSLVEEGEQCDAGLIGSEDSDPCCDEECRLKPNAKCSDRNSPCCRNCDYSQNGALCREAQPNACKNEAYCTYP